MTVSFGYRDDHLLPFFEYANILDLDFKQVFGLHFMSCADDLATGGTCVPWIEHKFQVQNHITRMSLAKALAEAERRIAEYLKVKVGPTYIEGEQHALSWPIGPRRQSRFPFTGHRFSTANTSGIDVKLDFRGIIAAGTQVFTQVGAGLPQIRTFDDNKGWGFTEDVVYSIGDIGSPLILSDEEVAKLCNLRIYEDASGIVDTTNVEDVGCGYTNPRLQHGHRLRPFQFEYDGTTLVVHLHKSIAVKHSNYLRLAKSRDKGQLRDLDFCDPDTFIDEIAVFITEYVQPAGEAILRRRQCSCQVGCDACEPIKVPVCLKPGDAESGSMKVVPIRDTNADDPEATECCWVETSWDSCCSYDSFQYYCREPISVCLNYVSSACGCWGDVCIPDTVCPDLANPVAWLATGMIPDSCECDCLANLFAYYQQDLKSVIVANRNRILTFADLIFGTTQGALSAFQAVKFRHNVHGSGQIFVG